jgi:hypothetical protein
MFKKYVIKHIFIARLNRTINKVTLKSNQKKNYSRRKRYQTLLKIRRTTKYKLILHENVKTNRASKSYILTKILICQIKPIYNSKKIHTQKPYHESTK